MMSREKAELIKGARMSQMDAILRLTIFLLTFLEKAKVTTVPNSQFYHTFSSSIVLLKSTVKMQFFQGRLNQEVKVALMKVVTGRGSLKNRHLSLKRAFRQRHFKAENCHNHH